MTDWHDERHDAAAGGTRPPEPVVAARDGGPWANSRDVAAFFGKRHDHVLRDVDNILENIETPNLGSWFFEAPYRVEGQERAYRSFDMPKDGFALLVMGYTGTEALAFKVAYIEAFNAMEAALRAGGDGRRALGPAELRAWVAVVDSALRVHGRAAARAAWAASPLPPVELGRGIAGGGEPLDAFLAARVRRAEGAVLPAADLHAAYCAWRAEAGGPRMAKQALGLGMRQRGHTARTRRISPRGKLTTSCHAYADLALCAPGDVAAGP